MFDIGFGQLLIVAVVALIVLGPERLPKAARLAGLWVRRARAQWYSVQSELERELAAEELKRSLHDAQQAVREVEDATRQARDGMHDELGAIHASVRAEADPASPASAVVTQGETGGVPASTRAGDGDEPTR